MCLRVRTGFSRPSLPRLWRLDIQAQPVAARSILAVHPWRTNNVFQGTNQVRHGILPIVLFRRGRILRPTGRDRRSVPKLATSETIRDSTCLVFAKARVWERLCQAGAFVMTPISRGHRGHAVLHWRPSSASIRQRRVANRPCCQLPIIPNTKATENPIARKKARAPSESRNGNMRAFVAVLGPVRSTLVCERNVMGSP